MVGAEGFLPDRQGALVERLRLAVVALVPVLDLSRKSAGYLSHLHCHRFKRERAFPA